MLNKKSGLIMLVMALILATSCKKEFTEIGVNLIGKPLFEGKLYETQQIIMYDERVPKVFSMAIAGSTDGNLPVTSLGFYNDDKFGTLEADIVCSVSPDVLNFEEDLGSDIQILDAKLVVPYFSHEETIDDINYFYVLDSVYGQTRFEIKIHELTYLLDSYDPDSDLKNKQYYYSDFDFSPYKSTVIGDTLDFLFSTSPYITYERNDDGTIQTDDDGEPVIRDSLGPHMVIKLDTTYFRHKIFDHNGEDVLTNSLSFRDYFRGLYIDAISNNNEGFFIQLPFESAKIIIQYTANILNDNLTPDDPSDDTYNRVYKEITLPLGGININHYNNTLSSYAQDALNNSDLINGDPNVVLKGEAGSQGVIKLFTDQELRDLRLKDWLINDASLYLYVNQPETDQMLDQSQRLMLYNYDGQKSLTDIYDIENSADNDYAVFDGTLQTDDDGQAYYRFGITRHMRNVLKNDSTNVRLGVRVCNSVNLPLKTNTVFRDPDASTPTGVILYGNQTIELSKKPVLKIYYTQPE